MTLTDISTRFPDNASFTASLVKLSTLAGRYFIADADSFDMTEEHFTTLA
jgi:hypothetical protein